MSSHRQLSLLGLGPHSCWRLSVPPPDPPGGTPCGPPCDLPCNPPCVTPQVGPHVVPHVTSHVIRHVGPPVAGPLGSLVLPPLSFKHLLRLLQLFLFGHLLLGCLHLHPSQSPLCIGILPAPNPKLLSPLLGEAGRLAIGLDVAAPWLDIRLLAYLSCNARPGPAQQKPQLATACWINISGVSCVHTIT